MFKSLRKCAGISDVLLIVLLFILFGGGFGGYHMWGPYGAGSGLGLVLIVLLILAVAGKL